MPIASADIKLRISGGVSETDPNNALGGAMSTVGGGIIVTDVINNDMDDITSVEASAGITIYHGYFWENTHGTLTYIQPKMYKWCRSRSAQLIGLGFSARPCF